MIPFQFHRTFVAPEGLKAQRRFGRCLRSSWNSDTKLEVGTGLLEQLFWTGQVKPSLFPSAASLQWLVIFCTSPVYRRYQTMPRLLVAIRRSIPLLQVLLAKHPPAAQRPSDVGVHLRGSGLESENHLPTDFRTVIEVHTVYSFDPHSYILNILPTIGTAQKLPRNRASSEPIETSLPTSWKHGPALPQTLLHRGLMRFFSVDSPHALIINNMYINGKTNPNMWKEHQGGFGLTCKSKVRCCWWTGMQFAAMRRFVYCDKPLHAHPQHIVSEEISPPKNVTKCISCFFLWSHLFWGEHLERPHVQRV